MSRGNGAEAGLFDHDAAGDARRLGILLVTDVYPPDCGGSGWSTHALALALTEVGHRAEVVGLDRSTRTTTQRVFEGIRIREVGTAGARRNPVNRLGARDYAHARVASWLAEHLAGSPEIDVVHGQHLHGGPPAIAAALDAGRAAVVTLRDYWPVCLHGTSWWGGRQCPGCHRPTTPEGSGRRLTGCMGETWGWPGPVAAAMVPWARRRLAARRDGVARAHRVVAVSEAVRGRVEPELDRASVDVVPNVVDAARAVAEAEAGGERWDSPDGPYLIAAGKLTPTKGFSTWIEWLAEAGCPWPLMIAGSGPEHERLQELAAGGRARVRLLGWIDHAALLASIRGARALLLPSRWQEPLSRLLLEAMSLGTPVVAQATGGSPEVIDSGVDGWLVEGPEDLAAALAELEDAAVAERVGSNARATAERRFSPAVVVPRIEAVYRKALLAAGRAPQIGRSP